MRGNIWTLREQRIILWHLYSRSVQHPRSKWDKCWPSLCRDAKLTQASNKKRATLELVASVEGHELLRETRDGKPLMVGSKEQ